MKPSFAKTPTVNEVPAVAVAGAVTTRCVAAPAETTIALVVPVIEDVAVSVAVIVSLAAVSSVAWKLPTPLVRVAFAGITADASVLVK